MTVLTAICAALIAVCAANQATNTAQNSLTAANNAFSISLYQALRSQPGNLVVSPLSVDALLSLVYLGAGGNTAAQLKTALHLPDDPAQVAAGFNALLRGLQSSGNTTSRIANKVYLQKEFALKNSFKQTAVKDFRSDAQEVDFRRNTEAARVAINQWVEQQTEQKIKELFAPGILDASTVMVLVNAIYFKGAWASAFQEEATRRYPFHTSSSSQVTVPFMTQRNDFAYGQLPSLDARVLQMPYAGNGFSFLLLLPNSVDGLEQLEAGLNQIDFAELTRNLSLQEVIVKLPKFKIESKFELDKILPQLGITDIFTTAANLTGITDHKVLVNKVIQKAFIEVTETGTVAAAATGFQIALFAAPVQNTVFTADHPFVFVLSSGSDILFVGRVASPGS